MIKNNDKKWAEYQLTEEEAINLAKSDVWMNWTDEEVVRFQLFQKRLCMPFTRFHEAIEKVLNRPVFTHEFGFTPNELKEEFLGTKEPPTFHDIVALIPKDKLIIISL